VVLFGVPAEATDYKKPDPDADATVQVMAMATAMKTLGKTNMVQVQTGTDGSYVATTLRRAITTCSRRRRVTFLP